MKYDPCGHICGIIRAPYRTKARFFVDSDEENDIHWYIVPPGTPALPYPSRINGLQWIAYPEYYGPVGEVFGADRPFDGWGRIPPPPAGHICGTEADFALGQSIDDPRPPLNRDVTGIPDCCHVFGGLALSGSGDIGNGGLKTSGDGGGTISVGSLVCNTATPMIMDRGYAYWTDSLVASAVNPTFFRINTLTAGVTYHFDAEIWIDSGTVVADLQFLWGAAACTGLDGLQDFGTGPTWSFDFTVPAGTSPTQPLIVSLTPSFSFLNPLAKFVIRWNPV